MVAIAMSDRALHEIASQGTKREPFFTHYTHERYRSNHLTIIDYPSKAGMKEVKQIRFGSFERASRDDLTL